MNSIFKKALVTGGGRGIGRSVSIELAQKGIEVIIGYCSNQRSAQETLDYILRQGGRGELVKMDLGQIDEITVVANKILDDHKKIDILVNNAAITIDKLFYEMSYQEWLAVMNVNLNANFLLTKMLLQPMLRARWGRIVNMASVSAQAGNAGQSNYAASKAGIIGFSKSLAKELAKRNITVNVVSPGVIDTDMTKGTVSDDIKKFIPIGRIGSPDDVAKTVAFLASDNASYITGQVIGVNGGLYM
ncbi:MAG: 3-oxoacyl-ACP reductase FabG [Oligoflexia bacterium]|nr:3-oxoacyl-ACP reductase FabG [Oligoflexia bacterium]